MYSMLPLYDKKIGLASLQPFAMSSWLMTGEQSKRVEQVTKEVLGNVAEWPLVHVWSSAAAAAVAHAAPLT